MPLTKRERDARAADDARAATLLVDALGVAVQVARAHDVPLATVLRLLRALWARTRDEAMASGAPGR